MSSELISSIDLSVFDTQESSNNCKDFKSCICIRRILTLSKYFSLLQINSDKDHQTTFINFIQTIYNTSDLIMDQFHLQKKHNHEIHDIMNHALNYYKIPSCDIQTCPHSSRLYRVDDKSSEIPIFDEDDVESALTVFIDIMDSIHHLIFHIFECGLRDIGDNKTDDKDDENLNDNEDEYYDRNFARMSARIASTRSNTQRFNRINTSNKFSIKIGSDDNSYNDNESGETTYLESIYTKLADVGIDDNIVEHLATYVSKEGFDTEAMDWDLQIESGGNIQNEIKNLKSVALMREMFQKTTSMFL